MTKFSNFGVLIKKDDGSFYVKVEKDLDIKINGEDFSGRYINMDKPTVKFDRMLKKGVITEEEYDEKCARFSKGGDLSWIRQEMSVKTGE